MILSDHSIAEALASGRLVIDPTGPVPWDDRAPDRADAQAHDRAGDPTDDPALSVARRPFDLATEPPVRAALFGTKIGRAHV